MALHLAVNETFKKLEMRLRALTPNSVRAVFRAVRPPGMFPISKALPQQLVRDCRLCASRIAMLDELPHSGVVAELGTYKGDFARQILARCNPRELHLVDIDYSQFDDSGLTDPRVKRHQGLSEEVMASFPDHTFDWVYVDADHSYAGTRANARASAAKIRPGGFLVFNDFAHIDPGLGRYGVHRAVVDFAIEAQWPFRYFAYEVAAMYDVVLQKPA